MDCSIKLSIILPIYNVKPYIEHCLNTLLKQDVSKNEYEIICINDGSTDGVEEILEEYSKYNSNVIVINQENKGVANARNRGLENTRGGYVWFVDPDDFIATNCLKSIFAILENHKLECLVVGRKVVNEKENLYIDFVDSHLLEIETNQKEIFQPTSSRKYSETTVAFKRANWFLIFERQFLKSNNIQYNTSLSYYEDEVLTYQCRKHLSKVGYYNAVVYYYRIRANSASKSNDENKNKKHYFALMNSASIFKAESKQLKVGFEEAEELFLNNKINENICLAVDLLMIIKDKKFVRKQLSDVKEIPDFVYSANSMSRRRKIAYTLKGFMPFKIWFWMMWLLHKK